nr:xylulose kinase-1 [Tanacetum cinerariifolium]
MTGNRALLTNFMEKFIRTVHFGNNDFAMIVGYGDVVIGSMTIKKVYYVEGKIDTAAEVTEEITLIVNAVRVIVNVLAIILNKLKKIYSKGLTSGYEDGTLLEPYRLSIWQVIQNGNCHVSVTTDTNEMIKVLPPKTAEEVMARERERKERTTLLMALPEDHLAKFHKMADAKNTWEAIKSRFGTTASSSNIHNVAFVSAENTSGTNDVSTAYSVSSLSVSKSQKEGSSSYTDEVIHSFFANQASAPQLDYDDLEQINDDDMEEMNLKWKVAMISMRIKKFYKRTGRKYFARDFRAKGNQDSRRRDVGYNGNTARDNGRRHAYQDDSKALVTINREDIDYGTNDVSTAYSVSSLSVSKSQKEGSSSYTDEVIHSFFANQASAPQLDYDDLEQINDDDMEEMNLKWKVAMISMRIKKFYKRTGRKYFARDFRAKGNQDSRRRDVGYNGNTARDNGETSSTYTCNDAMNVSCDSKMNDLLDDNNFFIFDDVNVRISPVSKMPFRKKPHDSMNIVQICLWIIDSGCSKHVTGNHALLTNFVEKFLGTVHFGNNDFAMIAGYRDVVIGSMTIKKVFMSKVYDIIYLALAIL